MTAPSTGSLRILARSRDAIERVMEIRRIAQGFSRVLYCHRNLAQARVTPTETMPQAVQWLRVEERRAFMQWLTRHGPFWEDARHHAADDWLEWNGEIVTDTAVGEAGWCCLNGIERALVSLIPSDWRFSPVSLDWVSETSGTRTVDIGNYWTPESVESALRDASALLASWRGLEEWARAQCTELKFTTDAFVYLEGHPFVSGAADRVLFILDTLNRLKTCFGADGQRTAEGNELYRDFFTGKKGGGGRGALFSDSSEGEKSKFKQEMTFKHPENTGKTIFCPWHGKVQTPQLRVHFSWPVRADEVLYVVYIGPKITKK